MLLVRNMILDWAALGRIAPNGSALLTYLVGESFDRLGLL